MQGQAWVVDTLSRQKGRCMSVSFRPAYTAISRTARATHEILFRAGLHIACLPQSDGMSTSSSGLQVTHSRKTDWGLEREHATVIIFHQRYSCNILQMLWPSELCNRLGYPYSMLGGLEGRASSSPQRGFIFTHL